MKGPDIVKKLGELWKALSSDEKKKYEEQANKDKERYKEAMKSYKPPKKESSSESSSSDSSSSSSSDSDSDSSSSDSD